MKVKMISRLAGPQGIILPGQVADVSDEQGAALVAGGFAVAVAESKAAGPPLADAGSPAAPAAETAVAEPDAETTEAVSRRGRPRKLSR